LAEEGGESAHLGVGAEGGGEKAEGVEFADPLAAEDVGFATGDALDIGAVDEADVETALLQQFKDGGPVDAGGFHRDGVYAALSGTVVKVPKTTG